MLLAAAAVFGVLHFADGSARIDLYAERGPCVGEARKAVYVPRDGPEVRGCWRLRAAADGEPWITVVFLDGDRAPPAPARLVRQAEES